LDLSAAYVYNGLLNDAKRHIQSTRGLQQKSIEFICDKFLQYNKS